MFFVCCFELFLFQGLGPEGGHLEGFKRVVCLSFLKKSLGFVIFVLLSI